MKTLMQLPIWNFLEKPKGVEVNNLTSNGEQMEIIFSWFAKILLDMKAIMKAKKEKLNPWRIYREWKKVFTETGDISRIPEFVYFVNGG